MVYVYTQINTAGNLIAGRESRPGETIYQDPTTGKYTTFPIEGAARTYDPYLSAGGRHEPVYRSSSDSTYTSPGDIAQFKQPPSTTTSIPDPKTGAQLNVKKDVYGNVLGVTATRDGEQLSQQEAAKVAKNVITAQAAPPPPSEPAVVKPVPISPTAPRPGEYGYHGTIERPGGIVQPIIPKLPETPRETTEAFMTRIESRRPPTTEPTKYVTQPIYDITRKISQESEIFAERLYPTQPIEVPGIFPRPFMRGVVKGIGGVPEFFGTSVIGAEAVAREIKAGRAKELPSAFVSGAAIMATDIKAGFKERPVETLGAFTGQALVFGGIAGVATRARLPSGMKLPSGVSEFIRSEEATGQLLRKRKVTQIQILERPKAELEKPVETIDISKAVIQPREKPVETIDISKAVIQPREKEYMRHAQIPYISPKGTMAGSIEESVARMRSRYVSKPSPALPIEEQKSILTEAFGELPKPVSVTKQKPFIAFKPTSVQIAAQEPIYKSLAVTKAAAKPVAISKSIALQKAVSVPVETGITKQIAKQKAVLIPKEIGRTKQITPQISAQKAISPTIPSLISKAKPTRLEPRLKPETVKPPVSRIEMRRELPKPLRKTRVLEPGLRKPDKRGKKGFFKFGEYAGIATSAQILGATSQKKPKSSIVRKKRR